MIVDQFETMLRFSEERPLVCGIALHTFVVGQPFRYAQLRKALSFITTHPLRDRVWFTRPGDIAAFAQNLPKGTIPGS
jgi:hypothetical protein